MEKILDAVVVGAGPAGSLTALQLARAGAQVLLIDRENFPRYKVCGCCLNAAALAALASLDLGNLPQKLGALPLKEFQLFAGGKNARLPLKGAWALSREALDQALVQECLSSGVRLLTGTLYLKSQLEGNSRRLFIRSGKVSSSVRTRLMVLAAGLGQGVAKPNSKIGLGATFDCGGGFSPGRIYMACAQAGYVGCVLTEEGKLNVAAAVDPRALKELNGPDRCVRAILKNAGLTLPQTQTHWSGTPRLTQRSPMLAQERFFAVGDAAGYVEPFTGEGLGWALTSARALAPIAAQALHGWKDQFALEWRKTYRGLIGSRQRTCSVLAAALRHPAWVRLAVNVLSRQPQWAAPVLAAVA